MAEIKAVIMDIDGTLVDGKSQQIPPETKAALLKIEESGVRLVLASGRPVIGMMRLARELKMDQNHGLCVAYNGARVVDAETMEVLFDQTMSVETGRAILHHMKQFEVRPFIVKDTYAYVTNVYDCMITARGKSFNIYNHEAHDNGFKLCEVDDLEVFADYPLNKILIIGEADYLAAHYQELYQPFTETTNAMFTAPFYYEFTDRGIDKVKALRTTLCSQGIAPEEMMAFGDAENDISMIQFAGIGVAMGNGTEPTKAAADEVTAANTEEGIAKSLALHFPSLIRMQ